MLIKTWLFMLSSLPILLGQETLYVSCNGLVGCVIRTFGAKKRISDPSSNTVLVICVHYRTPVIVIYMDIYLSSPPKYALNNSLDRLLGWRSV